MPVYSRYHSLFQIESLKNAITQLENEKGIVENDNSESNNKIPEVIAVNYFFNGSMPVFFVKYLHSFSFINGFKMFGGFIPCDQSLVNIIGKITPRKTEDCVLSTYYGYTSLLPQKTIIPIISLGEYLLKTFEQRKKTEGVCKDTMAGSNFKRIVSLMDSGATKLINVPELIYSRLEEANKRYDNIGISNIAVALLETSLNELESKMQPINPSNEILKEKITDEMEKKGGGESSNPNQSDTANEGPKGNNVNTNGDQTNSFIL